MSELAEELKELGDESLSAAVYDDPRFLSGIPKELPFLRVCWLRYAVPSYLGTVLGSGDVAYVYGSREAPP